MNKMKYQNKERTFSVDMTTTDNRGYQKITDIDSGVIFWLPQYVIKDFDYVFSWDRYLEENDNARTITTLQTELNRLQSIRFKNDNIQIGIKHIEGFLRKMKK